MSITVFPLRLQLGVLILFAGVALANSLWGPRQESNRTGRVTESLEKERALSSYKLTSKDACKFVEFVMRDALDFDPKTAHQHQQDALAWCQPAAALSLSENFYRYEKLDTDAKFFPVCVLNDPEDAVLEADGSVTVRIKGAFVSQFGVLRSSDWIDLHLICSVVVEPNGLRISKVKVLPEADGTSFRSYVERESVLDARRFRDCS